MKRFTETTKWDDPWFIELDSDIKNLWQYLCDKCDNAGVIDISIRLAETVIKGNLKVEEGLKVLIEDKRIEKLENGKYLISGFIPFQYGDLHPESNLHKNIISLLKKHNLFQRYINPKDTLNKGLNKGTSKGINKSKGKSKENKDQYLETVYLTQEEYYSLLEPWGSENKKYLSEEELKKGIEILDQYLRTKAGVKYKSHYAVLQGWVYDKIIESRLTLYNQDNLQKCSKCGIMYELTGNEKGWANWNCPACYKELKSIPIDNNQGEANES